MGSCKSHPNQFTFMSVSERLCTLPLVSRKFHAITKLHSIWTDVRQLEIGPISPSDDGEDDISQSHTKLIVNTAEHLDHGCACAIDTLLLQSAQLAVFAHERRTIDRSVQCVVPRRRRDHGQFARVRATAEFRRTWTCGEFQPLGNRNFS